MADGNALAVVAAIAAPLAAAIGLVATVIGLRNHGKINSIDIRIDGLLTKMLEDATEKGSAQATAAGEKTAAAVATDTALERASRMQTGPRGRTGDTGPQGPPGDPGGGAS